MSSLVTLSHLGWSTPDGAPLFTDLNLTFGPERAGLVGRNGAGKTTLLHLIAGLQAPVAGSVRRSGSIGLLRQTGDAPGARTLADLFGVRDAMTLLARAEAGRASAEDLAEADWTLPARLEAALARCGLCVPPDTRLSALSGGQRTRAGLAALVFEAPDMLLLDEPTNNLDADGRAAVLELIESWRGGALVVSHDRELLERMDAIIELGPHGAARYGGNYTAYRALKDAELDAAARALADAEKAEAEAARRTRQAEERAARRARAGKRDRNSGSQPKVLTDAMKNRAETAGGAQSRLRDARRAQAEAAAREARERVETLHPLSMEIAPTGLPGGRTVLRAERLTGGHDPARPVIRDLTLAMTGPERLAVAGANGSGKSTLLRLLTGELAPLSGTASIEVDFAMLDQEVSLVDPDLSLRETYLVMNPEAGETEARAALARFRYRAEDALKRVGRLSGGERLRAGLACTLGRPKPPALLILDEPTNHLDLSGLEALEAALCVYDGALLVVSHDPAFLDRIGVGRRIGL